jgi:hypothetical protein
VTFEDAPTLTIASAGLTRRERRVEREQARVSRGVAGWFAYAIAVAAVIVGAAWMASATSVASHRAHATHTTTASVVSKR